MGGMRSLRRPGRCPSVNWLIAAICTTLGAPLAASSEAAPADAGPPAPYQAAVMREAQGSGLRRLAVEERIGVARRAELVRVPLFFAAGECPEPSAVGIVDETGRAQVTQADDIRRGPDGGVSRMELWFATDLAPWQRRHFQLVRQRAPSVEAGVACRADGDELHVREGADEVVIGIAGAKAGALLRVGPSAAPRLNAPAGLRPAIVLTRKGSPAIRLPGDAAAADVAWSEGPLFVRVVARWRGPDGAQLWQVYRIPRDGGGWSVEQTILPPEAGGVGLAKRSLLTGAVTGPNRLAAVATELRPELRGVSGATVNAIVGGAAGGFLAVPVTSGGGSGRMTLEDGSFTLAAPAHFAQASNDAPAGTLRAFWTAAELVPVAAGVDADGLWSAFHQHVQPLVAVVDEPGAGRAELQAALQALVREMKPVGWRQNAARAAVLGSDGAATKIMKRDAREADSQVLARAAEAARKKLTDDGRKRLRDDQKGRAAGPLDPYEITYTQSAAAALAAFALTPAKVGAIGRAHATAARMTLGRGGDDGWPYLDCFARALNMQMGPMLFGLEDGKGDEADATFYRDLVGAPAVRAVYGRAVRPYALRTGEGADASDTLYQAVVDFWMRTAELTSGETLEVPPLAYARYTDCIDVMADVYHAADASDKRGLAPAPRANFWRSQPHTHRWLNWSCAPFVRLIESPGDLTGATEAIRYCEMLRGRWKNWPDLTYYELAALLTREDFRPAPRLARPPKPRDLRVEPRGDQNGGMRLNWTAVDGAVAYRVYRFRRDGHGTAVRWLRSPYASPPGAPVRDASFVDDVGRASDRYVVTAVDAAGRESRWFPEEPDSGMQPKAD